MEQQQERWQSKMEPRTQLRLLNSIIQGYVSTLTVFYDVELRYRKEDTYAQQSPISIVTLILPLEATNVSNPIRATEAA